HQQRPQHRRGQQQRRHALNRTTSPATPPHAAWGPGAWALAVAHANHAQGVNGAGAVFRVYSGVKRAA
ncbi:hypothetical protein, partial [Acidocella facilis]|uniref:hypothetical protein n=1 Tax=Acidocella facilis TaxID=525 RepID=UPI001F287F61